MSAARACSGVSSENSNGWSAAIDSRIRASMAGRSSGVSGRGEQEVVVEAVGDDRADPELRAGEQVHHGLGQDVRRAVAHRAELAGGAVVHELAGAPAFGRLGHLLDFDRCVVAHHIS